QLPLTLSTFRIPAVAFGIVTLILFFTICRRYFGAWAALGATALLSANQMFFQAQHTMTVLVVTGASLLFVIERLQALELRYWSLRAWLGLSVALALVALHYGPGRLFTVLLAALWLVKLSWLLRKHPHAAHVGRRIKVLAGYSAATFILLMGVLDYRNLFSLARVKSFLFPTYSEIMPLAQPMGPGGTLEAIGINARILFGSLLGQTGDFHSRYSSYYLADYRYPLLDVLVVPFVVAGVIVAVIRSRRRTTIFATPWASVLALLAVTSLPLLASAVFFRADGVIGTLSTHRLYFCLFPLHMLVAASLHWVSRSGIARAANYGVALGVAAVFIILVAGVTEERSRFMQQVQAANWRVHGPEARSAWADDVPNVDRQDPGLPSHFQQHAQYAHVANQVGARLARAAAPSGAAGGRRLIFVDVKHFSESPLSPPSLHFIAKRNFHSVFLALYVGEEGFPVNPIIMIDPKRPREILGGVGYQGKPRAYSARMTLGPDSLLAYEEQAGLIPVVAKVTGDPEFDILVTTPAEEDGARRWLSANGMRFEYLRIVSGPG
ncbi:MAG TPA: hypothetical protein VMY38_03190, partial [Gemmatimonadaceae bacterium]|nr:hypothetical protein [Gemmatimonadaceae bacterium]